MIEVLTTGALNTVQDQGRFGYRNLGIGVAGPMDPLAFALGNILLGNAPQAAGVEVTFFPFRMRFDVPACFAVTGANAGAALDGRALPPYWASVARAGQCLLLDAPARGARAYVCIAGGLDLPVVLGSRSTDLKARFGGLEGRGLRRGDRIGILPPPSSAWDPATLGDGVGIMPPEQALTPPGSREAGASGDVVVRAIPAAEHDAFTPQSQRSFWQSAWTITPNSNRMGLQFSGAVLERDRPRELLSHGIVPGVIQVPPSGQPIIQLCEANTCGGYPKMATVIAPDLRCIAQARIGARVRFIRCTHEAAVAAIREVSAYEDGVRRVVKIMRSKP